MPNATPGTDASLQDVEMEAAVRLAQPLLAPLSSTPPRPSTAHGPRSRSSQPNSGPVTSYLGMTDEPHVQRRLVDEPEVDDAEADQLRVYRERLQRIRDDAHRRRRHRDDDAARDQYSDRSPSPTQLAGDDGQPETPANWTPRPRANAIRIELADRGARSLRRARPEEEDEHGEAIDSEDEHGTIFSRSIANGDQARARRRRRLIPEWDEDQHAFRTPDYDELDMDYSPDDVPVASTSTAAITTEAQTVASRLRREIAQARLTRRPATRQREMGEVLEAAGRPSYESPDEVEWRQRVEGVRLRRASANASFLSMVSRPDGAKPVLQLFCAGCKGRVCCRAVEANVVHGQGPVSTRDGARRTRLTRTFTSDSPPPCHTVGMLGPPERVVHAPTDDAESAEASSVRNWDCCACVRVGLGCLGCGSHLGWHILTPCALCLRDVTTGHVFLFLPNSVYATMRDPSALDIACPDRVIPGEIVHRSSSSPSTPEAHLTWSPASLPSRASDFSAGLVGDPVHWLMGNTYLDGHALGPVQPAGGAASATTTRLPFWLLKARIPLTTSTSAGTTSSMLRPSVTYSNAALSRSPAIRLPISSTAGETVPIRPTRPKYDLDNPDGGDCHAVLEPVEYGSLSGWTANGNRASATAATMVTRQMAKDSEPSGPFGGLASAHAAVGR